MSETNELIFSQRHPELKDKESNWKLIYNSYLGGTSFLKGEYLIRYPKESLGSFDIRKSRAVYFNQVSPIVDMLSGLMFLNEPTRQIPKEFQYLIANTSKGKKINEFMRIVAAHSFMFTCGILIDSPLFDPNEIVTEGDRIANNINPYAVFYLPFKIRDFNINEIDGELDWVLLDNSYYSHSDPFKTGETITKYTLWTRNFSQDFIKYERSGGFDRSEERLHGLGFVPFRFVSWRDDNNDFISETVCEDIAMVSKLIYNNMSYMDEMLAAGTFKMLAYPSRDGGVPDSLTKGGVGNLGIIPYEIDSSNPPAFIGASLSDIDPFIKAIGFYMAEILKKVGLSTDETKEFVKSGAAKKIDFQKMRALLVSGSLMMGKLEEWMFNTAAAWQGKSTPKLQIEYTSAFSDEDLQAEVTMLTELLVHPIEKLKKNVLKVIAKKLLTNNLDPDTLGEIYDDIDLNLIADPANIQPKKSAIDINAEAEKIKTSQGKEQQK